MGFWASKTLLSAVELGLFTELADGPLDLAAVTGRLKLNHRSARDFLDALVALGMLDRRGEQYSNVPATDTFLDRRKPAYVGGLLEMANARLYPFWGALTEALRTGEPQNEAKQGRDLFDELYNDQQRLAEFLKAMTGLSLGSSATIANKFPWADSRTFVDIGAAQGGLAVTVARAHSHLSGVGFDLPAVRPHFEAFVAEQGMSHRLAFCGGDFFADPLPSADVVVMGHRRPVPVGRRLPQQCLNAIYPYRRSRQTEPWKYRAVGIFAMPLSACRLEKVGKGSMHGGAGAKPMMQHMEPIMTKQKKTTTKPNARGANTRTPLAPATAAPKTKLGRLEGMLRRAEGATIGQIAKALDWQMHSVRGAISGSLKKKQGLTVVAEKTDDGERVYRIAG